MASNAKKPPLGLITLNQLRERLSPDVAAQLHLACKRFVAEPATEPVLVLVEGLHRQGENMLAFILANATLEFLEDQTEQPDWLEALQITLAKIFHAMGSYQAAIVKLKSLLAAKNTHDRAEILGNLASVYKSMALEITDQNKREQWLEESYQHYVQCFEDNALANNYWLGVNALSIAAARHHDDLINQYLPGMVAACQADIVNNPEDFWALATLAELGLVAFVSGIGHPSAEQFLNGYRQAQSLCKTPVQRKSARKNLPLLLGRLRDQDPKSAANIAADIDAALPPLRLSCFTGHRVDGDDRPVPRFPSANQSAVYEALLKKLAECHIEMGFSSLSNGGDMLFAEALLQRQSALQAILPFEPFQFLAESVRSYGADDADWQRRYTKLLEDRSGNIFLWYAGRGVVDPDEAAIYYEHANRVLYGLAVLRAKELGAQLQPMALLNPREKGSLFGAQHTVDVWRSKGHAVHCLDPMTATWQTLQPENLPLPSEEAAGDTVIRTMLFADLKGFSRFNDVQIQTFCQQLLPLIKREFDQVAGICELNTWGDGLFVVFETSSQGAEAALKLCELMAQPKVLALWNEAKMDGLPAIRVSLHSAPVRRMLNPLTGQVAHWGTNINIAARIEPVTPINQVYASVATAALLAFDDSEGYHADFVGVVPLAKEFGAQEIFRVRRV